MADNVQIKLVERATVIKGIKSRVGEDENIPPRETIAIVRGDVDVDGLLGEATKGATLLKDARVVIIDREAGEPDNVVNNPRISFASTKNDSLIKLDARTHLGTEYPEMTLSTDDRPFKSPDEDSKHILILGAGVSGLMVAWMLLDKGYRVTIFADDWAWTKDFKKSRMTSQIAGALWEFPPGGCGLTEIEAAGDNWATVEHYQEWALQSYEFYHKYESEVSNLHERYGASLGLRFADLHQFFYHDLNNLSEEEKKKLEAIREAHTQMRMMGSKLEEYTEHANLTNEFPSRDVINLDATGPQKLNGGYTHRAPILNTDKAMAYLMAVVKTKGANLETRSFKEGILNFGKELLANYRGDAIVNATGLGAGKLMNDTDVYPVRGAVLRVDNTRRGLFRHLNDAYLVPAQRDTNNFPTKTIFIVPRSDDVLYVGSIIQPHNDDMSLTPESPEVEAMWDRAGDFIPRLRHAKLVPEYQFAQGLRPFSKKNAKVRTDEKADFRLVHNYGHGGSGWTLGIGTARCAILLVEKMLSVSEPFVDENLIGPDPGLQDANAAALSRRENINNAWETARKSFNVAAETANKDLYPSPAVVEPPRVNP